MFNCYLILFLQINDQPYIDGIPVESGEPPINPIKNKSEKGYEEEKESQEMKPFGWLREDGNKAFIEKIEGYMPKELKIESYE
jgi:hypothetical protein